ncbi:hypothetical protein V5799_029925 [Amblyomma americanum]|uniref:EF-hand domain-containing protein n=1 Tax=Amblyomma americanum TaxID=6943 RepID=A0AAQ4EPR7_AMBAM
MCCLLNISEFRDCFYLNAHSGQIRTLDELTLIMRSLGLSPTITELKKYYKDKGGKISFADFLEIMHAHSEKESIPDEIVKAFRASDKTGSGQISGRELRRILLNWGEKLTPREAPNYRCLHCDLSPPHWENGKYNATHQCSPLGRGESASEG